jgi:hypothetical protein
MGFEYYVFDVALPKYELWIVVWKEQKLKKLFVDIEKTHRNKNTVLESIIPMKNKIPHKLRVACNWSDKCRITQSFFLS